MILLRCRFKPHKIQQKAADQHLKTMGQAKSPDGMGSSHCGSVRSQKLTGTKLKLKVTGTKVTKPRLRGYNVIAEIKGYQHIKP